jgi:cytochrome c oxidase cbb3-type subunit 4
MTMELSMIHAIWTIVLMLLFIGIVIWAWSGKQKARFDAAARLPFDEDPGVPTNNTSKENSHG